MNKTIIMFWVISVICLSSLISGCVDNAQIQDDKITVSVSIVPQQTFVSAVAGDLVNVVTLIPPGNSPANYQPTPRIMEEFSKSSIYFAIGVPTEQANILNRIEQLNKDIVIVQLDEKVSQVYSDRYFGENNGHNGRDPHIWMSPKRVKVMINIIAGQLSAIDPDNRGVYEKNASAYIEKLDILDEEIQNNLRELKNRSFIIYHPSLGYFADDYNLKMIAIETEGKEATAKELQNIIDIAHQKNIKVIFHQQEIDSAKSKTLAQEIGGETQLFEPLSPNYLENLRTISEILKSILEMTEK